MLDRLFAAADSSILCLLLLTAALVQAIRENRALHHVSLKFAAIEDRGAYEFVELLADGNSALVELDLSNTKLSYTVSLLLAGMIIARLFWLPARL